MQTSYCCTTNTLAIFSHRRQWRRRNRAHVHTTWPEQMTLWCWVCVWCAAIAVHCEFEHDMYSFTIHTHRAPAAVAMLSSIIYTDDDDLICVSEKYMVDLCDQCNSRACLGHSTLCSNAISLQPQFVGDSPSLFRMSRAWILIKSVVYASVLHNIGQPNIII